MKNILVAYATKTGSTKEVAEEMARVMTSGGMRAEAKPMAEVGSLEAYDGVVVGAPINGMRWLPEALAFVEANKAKLASVPTAYFLLSVAIAGKGLFTKKVFSCLDPAAAIVKPVNTGFFGGFMSQEPPMILRLVFGLKKDAPKDARDWEAIRRWAGEVSSRITSAPRM
jgi:menaquinone-dependent protoporphyrinogen oxidase